MKYSMEVVARRKRGSAASVILAFMILAIFMVCAMAMDISHCVMIRTELQSACDAGALAGAAEIAHDPLTNADIQKGYDYATGTTARNKADQIAVSSSSPDTNVNVAIVTAGNPRTVTVRASRQVHHFFGKMFGAFNDNIATVAVAGATKGLVEIDPGQIFPLSVDLNHPPPKGPQKDTPLNTYVPLDITANKPFTAVLNPQTEKNAAWLRWDGTETLVLGQTIGVFNGVQAVKVKPISEGDFLYLPLIEGGPPYNKNRVIIGLVGFKVTKVNFPTEITGLIKDPIILSGVPGTPLLPTLDPASTGFLEAHAPWTVKLIQ